MVIKKIRGLSRFVIAETQYHTDQKLNKHSHSDARMVILIKGNFTENCEGEKRSFNNTGFIFRPPNEKHSNHFHKSGAFCLNISLKENWVKYLGEMGVKIGVSAETHTPAKSFLAIKLYQEFHSEDGVSSLAIEGLLLEIITEITRFKSSNVRCGAPPHWLKQTKELLREQFSKPLTLAEIAGAVGVHPVHLSRTFNYHHGLTVAEYIRQLRIESARRMISETKIPLAEIALSVGFYDQAHFTKNFKRLTGLSPARYRLLLNSR